MATLLSKLCRDYDFTATLHETCGEDDNDERVCIFCSNLVIGCPTYILETDDDDSDRADAHKSCAELPGNIQHRLHPQHPLTACPLGFFMCDGCKHVSFAHKYRCKECKFNLDLQCVSKNEGHEALKEIVEEKDTIYHRHKLQLVYFYWSITTGLDDELSNLFDCCCCLKSCLNGRNPTYACNVCFESKKPLLIHKSCLDRVPRQVQSPFHPEHPLFIQRVHGKNFCELCDDSITGIALACDKCFTKFHVSCGSRTARGLRLNLHPHDMYYVIFRPADVKLCYICQAECKGALYRCVKCDINVHMECIPLLEIVEHESHDHPLKLTNSVVTHRDDDEYRCDICEEEGDIKHHSYYCNECNFIAHIECVHSHEDDTSETEDAEVETDDARVENDDAKVETDDARAENDDAKVETDDAHVENDDAKVETDDEVHDSQDDGDARSYSGSSNSEHSSDGEQYDKSNVDDNIVNIKTKIEELALQIEVVATSDKRIENVKADMVGLVFQLEDLRTKLTKRWYY